MVGLSFIVALCLINIQVGGSFTAPTGVDPLPVEACFLSVPFTILSGCLLTVIQCKESPAIFKTDTFYLRACVLEQYKLLIHNDGWSLRHPPRFAQYSSKKSFLRDYKLAAVNHSSEN